MVNSLGYRKYFFAENNKKLLNVFNKFLRSSGQVFLEIKIDEGHLSNLTRPTNFLNIKKNLIRMLSSNSSNNLRLFFKNKTIKKFLISGNNSFYKSGANKIFPKILKEKIVEFYFKTSNIPDLKELKKIAV